MVWKESVRIFTSLNFLNNQKYKIMGTLLYLIATVLLTVWAIASFGFNAGGFTNMFLFAGLMVLFTQIFGGESRVRS